MVFVDWLIVAAYLAFALGVGFLFRRRAGRDTTEYFLSGRRLPWWIAGTSIVATMFAADTPLAVTGLVAANGIAGTWYIWNFAAAHLVAAFFFARLWRRAGVITDLELVAIRYSGRPAAVLRGFRAVWEGVVLNCIIMGWVILAMVKILDVLVDLDLITAQLGLSGAIDGRWFGIIICLVIAVVYTVLSGFWGVVVTDMVQFLIAMIGAIALAVIALGDVGGIGELKLQLAARYGEATRSVLAFVPDGGDVSLPLMTFAALMGVNWWATRDAGGTAYMVQRMLATKNETHSFWAVLWFCFLHYIVRPWPWILVGLVALVILPGLDDPELGYPMLIVRYMPAGLLGVMVASMLAAFMSTIDTLLNWGVSLLVNDLYKPFLRPGRSEPHYVATSKLFVLLLMAVGGTTAYLMQSIRGAWELFFNLTVGIGSLYIMRWWWWRVNAWSEIAAWSATAVIYLGLTRFAPALGFGWTLIATALGSTACWVGVALLTRPTDQATLLAFYERVRPGPWWGPIARLTSVEGERLGWREIGHWAAGLVFIYAGVFAVGKALLFGWWAAAPYLAASVVSASVVLKAVRRLSG